jgi:hypothetical protein
MPETAQKLGFEGKESIAGETNGRKGRSLGVPFA